MNRLLLTSVGLLTAMLQTGCRNDGTPAPEAANLEHGGRFPQVRVVNVFEPEGESNVRSSFRLSEGVALIGTEESGKIFKTEDNGQTWKPVLEGQKAWGIEDVRNYIRGLDGSIYITTTEPASIGRSEDEGTTWDLIYKAPASRTVGLVQLEDGSILVGLRRSENNRTSIIRTEDYFRTTSWIPLSESEPRQNVTCFGYWGGDVVLAGVGYEGSGKIYKSTDQGLTWSKQAEIEGARDVMGFYKGEESIYVLTSGIGTLYKSSDLGETWTIDQQFWTKGFLGECEAFDYRGNSYLLMSATDQSNEIYRHLVLISDDAGRTWHEWIDLANEARGMIFSSKDSGGGASNITVLSSDTIVVGVGNHSVQGRAYTLQVDP